MVYAILYSDGQLAYRDLKTECKQDQWVPVCSIEQNNNIKIVCFEDVEVAHNFVKRNINRQWVKGVISLIPKNLDLIKSKGWDLEILSFPRKYKDQHGVTIGFQILDLEHQPDLMFIKT